MIDGICFFIYIYICNGVFGERLISCLDHKRNRYCG